MQQHIITRRQLKLLQSEFKALSLSAPSWDSQGYQTGTIILRPSYHASFLPHHPFFFFYEAGGVWLCSGRRTSFFFYARVCYPIITDNVKGGSEVNRNFPPRAGTCVCSCVCVCVGLKRRGRATDSEFLPRAHQNSNIAESLPLFFLCFNSPASIVINESITHNTFLEKFCFIFCFRPAYKMKNLSLVTSNCCSSGPTIGI